MDIKTLSILSKIQKDLKAPKDKGSSFIKYKYRSCEAILEAVKPLLPEGVVIIINDEIVLVGDRHYVKATATIYINESTFSSTAYAREPLSMASINESQVTGSTSSYARKYAISGLLAIDDNKDADEHASEGRPNTPKSVDTSSDEHICPKHQIKMTRFEDTVEPGLHYYAHIGTQGTKCYGR